ncbi:MAG TPA: MliC family protein [Alphaproteobacteria bacterium]|jgi:membrane-bound inhibitor of C-type lysozyme
MSAYRPGIRRFAICLSLLGSLSGLAACSSEPTTASPVDAVFNCGPTRVEARFMDRRMALFIDGKAYALQQDASASGARYTGRDLNTPIEFWNKGNEATLTFGTRQYPTCVQTDEKP